MSNKFEALDEILSGMTQEELLEELQSYEAKGPLAVDFLEDEGM